MSSPNERTFPFWFQANTESDFNNYSDAERRTEEKPASRSEHI